MRRILGALAVAWTVVGGASAAMADGMSIKDGPAPVADSRSCDGGPFAGFYIGAAVGYAGQDTTNTDVYNFSGSVSYDDGGFAGSLYSGYNVQCGRLVVGYESDYNFMDSDNSYTVTDGSGKECDGGSCFTITSDIKYVGTSRLRIGLVHSDTMLIYATGGIAYAKVESTLDGPFALRASDEDWKFGWTVGGGVEFMRHGNWSLRAEGLYMDLGDKTYSYSTLVCNSECEPRESRQRWEDEIWVARVGLTYKLGSRREVDVPLK